VAVEVGLYRVAQEALHNVLQHAQAQRAIVRLVITPEQAQLTIEDDGRGFDEAGMAHDRYGIRGMNERVSLLGGQLTLRSTCGMGTTIVVTAPLGGGVAQQSKGV
jgi:signal transduction histidine kinase